MIPVDPRLCEVLESAMELEPDNGKLRILSDYAFHLMMLTEKNFQNNLYIWSDEKQKNYGMRIPKYGNVIQALNAIKVEKATLEILDLGIRDSKSLFIESNLEYSNDWDSFDIDKRRGILENVLLPLMLISRFLERNKLEFLAT